MVLGITNCARFQDTDLRVNFSWEWGIVPESCQCRRQVFMLAIHTCWGCKPDLVRASRLMLVDSNWSPALHLQAMGRLWHN